MASLNSRKTPAAPLARTSTNSNRLRTFNGAIARQLTPEQTLERTVMACMLWEGQFYESGVSIADRIVQLADEVSPLFLADLAYRTRNDMKLRHAPLLLLRALIKRGGGQAKLVEDAIANTVARADEVTELLSIYWATNGDKRTLSAQLKKGLARAIAKFDEYQLAKWNKDTPVKLRDALRLVHAKPKDEAQSAVFKGLVAKTLKSTKTWEAKQSKVGVVARDVAKANDLTEAQTEAFITEAKGSVWTDQLTKGELGYDALLKNLRNMLQTGVDADLIAQALVARKGAHRVLPFRFVAAFNAIEGAPVGHTSEGAIVKSALDRALTELMATLPQFGGKTAVLVDVSGSMKDKLSAKSDLLRYDAAASLAALFPGECDVYSFSNRVVKVSSARGLAAIQRIVRSQPNGGTELAEAISQVNGMGYDRLIVLTDEQANAPISAPTCRYGYLINLASYEASVGEKMPVNLRDAPRKGASYDALSPRSVEYGEWLRLSGFSENVFRYIAAHEAANY